MVKHYSKNIQNVIQGELFAASQSIKIAVAWFTNDLLFQPLLLKLATGIKVDVILNKDEINLSSSIDFNLFVQRGGNLYWNESNRLMHDKFCIIDDRVVITGSYNWTNKAEINYESISVFTDEQESLRDYNARFQSLTRSFAKQTVHYQPQPIVHQGKCPISLQPYTKLKFYHSIKLFESENTPILANQCEGGPYALLDNKTFLPRTQFMFSDYSSFIPNRNYLWLKGETKWGLFDCEKLEFVVKPQFDEVDNRYCKGMLVKIDEKFGLYSYAGDKLLACAHDEIVEVGELFQIKSDGKFGLLLKNGYTDVDYKIVLPQYDHIGEYNSKSKAVIVKKDNKYGVLSANYDHRREGYPTIPCEYDEIVEYHNCLRLKKGGKYGLICDYYHSTACIYDNIQPISDLEHAYLLQIGDKWTAFDYEGVISNKLFDKIEYKKDKDGNEMLSLRQLESDKVLYGVYILQVNGCRLAQSWDIAHYERYSGKFKRTRFFDCEYDNITQGELFGKAILYFKRGYKLNEIIVPQRSLYIMNEGIILGGIESWCTDISFVHMYDIKVVLLYNGTKCRVYLVDQKTELRGCYDNVSIFDGVLCLEKNNKYGAYLIGTQKYIDCVYDDVINNVQDNTLHFENHNSPNENIKVKLNNI